MNSNDMYIYIYIYMSSPAPRQQMDIRITPNKIKRAGGTN